MNERHRTDRRSPTATSSTLLYQTLVGAWPLTPTGPWPTWRRRPSEAKEHTSWIDPDPAYDDGPRARSSRASLADAEFAADAGGLRRPAGRARAGSNSLAQTLLKLTSPGVPDIYQGTELWDHSPGRPRQPPARRLRAAGRAAGRGRGLAPPGTLAGAGRRGPAQAAADPAALCTCAAGGPEASAPAPATSRWRHRRRRGRPRAWPSPGAATVVTRGAAAASALRPAGDWADTPLTLPPGALGATTRRRQRSRGGDVAVGGAAWRSPWLPGRAALPCGVATGVWFRQLEFGRRFEGAAVTTFRCGRPRRRAGRARDCRRRAPVPMAPANGAAGGRSTSPRPGPGTDYRSRSTAGRPSPIRARRGSPTASHGPSRVVDHAAFAWTDQRGGRGAAVGGRRLRAARRDVHARGDVRRGHRAARPPRRPRRHRRRADAGGRVPRRRAAGATTASTCSRPHHAYGGPDGLKRLVDAGHAAGLGVILDVVYNHLGPDGNYLGAFGPYFTDRYSTPWGEAVNFDGAGSDEVRRFVFDNACHVAARLPRRRPAPRRRPRHLRQVAPSTSSRSWPRRGRDARRPALGRRCSSSPRATSTTRGWSARRGRRLRPRRRSGATTSTTPCTAP